MDINISTHSLVLIMNGCVDQADIAEHELPYEDDSEDSTTVVSVNLISIWDSSKIVKLTDENVTKKWKCLHFEKSWSTWSETK